MKKRNRFPEGSMMNYYDSRGRFRAPRRFNSGLWGWRIYKLKTAAPGLLVLLLLIACVLSAVRGGA